MEWYGPVLISLVFWVHFVDDPASFWSRDNFSIANCQTWGAWFFLQRTPTYPIYSHTKGIPNPPMIREFLHNWVFPFATLQYDPASDGRRKFPQETYPPKSYYPLCCRFSLCGTMLNFIWLQKRQSQKKSCIFLGYTPPENWHGFTWKWTQKMSLVYQLLCDIGGAMRVARGMSFSNTWHILGLPYSLSPLLWVDRGILHVGPTKSLTDLVPGFP